MNASSCSGIVVKQAEPSRTGRLGKPHPLLPTRMAPADMRRQFLVGVGGVEDDQRRAARQREHGGIERPVTAFDVGQVRDGTVAIVDPVAGRAAWMIEARRAQRDAWLGRKRVAGEEVVKFDTSLEGFDLDGE